MKLNFLSMLLIVAKLFQMTNHGSELQITRARCLKSELTDTLCD